MLSSSILVKISSLGSTAETKSGEMVGGLIVDRKGPWPCIDYLWVSESARSNALGSKLMEMAEKARFPGKAVSMTVDTFSFRALLYENRLYTSNKAPDLPKSRFAKALFN